MLEYSFQLCQTKFHVYLSVILFKDHCNLHLSSSSHRQKITLICWQNHPGCEGAHTQPLKIPSSNVVCTSRLPSKLWVLSCLLLLEGMKRRFVFISRFSIAGGLASGAVVVQFPVCTVCLSACADVHLWVSLSMSASGYAHNVWVSVCLSVCVCACVHVQMSECVSPSLEKPVSS